MAANEGVPVKAELAAPGLRGRRAKEAHAEAEQGAVPRAPSGPAAEAAKVAPVKQAARTSTSSADDPAAPPFAPRGGDPQPVPHGSRALPESAGALGANLADPHLLPEGFALRLAPHVPHRPGQAVEITLTPEELGKVRLHVSLSEDALSLTIAAHRPETLDLLRRHIDQLAQDFRDLGFDRLQFDFARDQGQPNLAERDTAGAAAAPPRSEGDAAPPPSRPPRPAPALAAGGGGLDLRL